MKQTVTSCQRDPVVKLAYSLLDKMTHLLLVTMAYFNSLQLSHSVVSNSLQPHELQHTRPPCPSPNPEPTKLMSIESVMPSNHLIFCLPLLLLPSIFPASESCPMSQLFASGGQSTGVSASTSVLPMNTQDRSPLGWTGWISLQPNALSRVFFNTTVKNHQFFVTQLSL